MYDNYSSLLKHGWILFFLQHVSNCINLDEAVEILKKNVIKFMVSVNFIFFFSLLVSLTFSFSTPCGKIVNMHVRTIFCIMNMTHDLICPIYDKLVFLENFI